MASSTTQAAWRSHGGAADKSSYAGDMLMAAEFYIPFGQQTANTAVQRSLTDLSPVVLPPGFVPVSVQIAPAVTGGTTPTLNLGLRNAATAVNVATALLAATPAVSTKATVDQAGATAGTVLGNTQAAVGNQILTGALTGTPTGGALTGRILYYVANGGAPTA
jgi:hypothetical protein